MKQLRERLNDTSSLLVLSPIPVYAARGKLGEESVAKTVRRTGWRAIVMANDDPVALVDLPNRLGLDPRPTSVRGRDAAAALFRVLQEADRVPSVANQSYELRFVVFPSLFVTALWLSARKSLFIPTRVGSHGRPLPTVYTEPEFVRLLKRRYAAKSRPKRRAAKIVKRKLPSAGRRRPRTSR